MDDERVGEANRVAVALGELYSAARMPIMVLRPSGEIVAANPAALAKYGYSQSELTGMRIHELIMDNRNVDGEIARAMLHEPLELTRRPHRKKDGGIIYVLPSAFQISLGGEALLVSFLQDVTRLDAAENAERLARKAADELETHTKALRAELLAADRLATIGRLATGIAHEVNNPAALVTVNLGVLRDRIAKGDPRVDEALAMLDDSLDAMARIRDIVRDVKGLAGERAKESVDLSTLAAGVVRMTRLDTTGRASVDAVLEPEVFAKVRGSRVSQVLTNLLINAAQAIPPTTSERRSDEPPSSGPHIMLRTFRDGGEACIEVSDTGPGVPSHLVERIFEPFFTTRASAGGMGLGLWLARGIIEEEGGTLALQERPGGGAVFRVSLPAAGPPGP